MYVVVDFETTGLEPSDAFVIEVGAIRYDENHNEVDRFHSMCECDIILPDFITKLTGITDDDLVDQPAESDVLAELIDFVGDDYFIAHHAPFEMAFVAEVTGHHFRKFICTRVMSRLIEPDEKANLKHVVDRWGVDLDGHHRSMNDVEATAEIFFKMKEYAAEKMPELDFENHLLNSDERPLMFYPKHVRQITEY